MDSVKKKIKKKILDLGFDLVGFSDPHVDEDTSIKLKKYLNKNYHGEMKWLERHYEKKVNPKKIWDKVKTIIVLGLNYGPNENPFILNSFKKKANISVYAKNKDYHSIINKQLNKFKEWFDFEFKNECKIFVDTAPVMEKYFAQKSNIGWQGKHTNIVSKKFGSWLFLSEIFIPFSVTLDKLSNENCGSCDKCIKICPTNAFVDNYKIDSKRCISYLTIEYKGPIPRTLREKIGNKIYGCDDCLSVCPWNKFSNTTKNKSFISEKKEQNLEFFLNFNKNIFNKYFKDSPIKRIGWTSFIRNVLIASGNSESKSLIPKVKIFLTNEDPIIRGAAVWTINRLLKSEKKKILEDLRITEKNKYVLNELNFLD